MSDPLFDSNGILNMDVQEKQWKEQHFFRELAAGADGGADGPNKGCRDIYHNLGDQLFNK